MANYFNQDDEKLKWSSLDKKTLLSTVVFDVTSQHCVSSEKLEGDYIICDARDWVTVIPEYENKFLMVKQWRHGEKSLSIEFPGGVIEKGEEPQKAALRELQEETGAVPGSLIELGCVNPNPALFSNHFHVYLAKDLKFTGKQNLDDDEYINCIELDKEEVIAQMGGKDFCHGLMAAALFLYLKHNR